MPEKRIGVIDHYYPRAHAAVVDLQERGIKVGQTVHIIGHGVDVTETVASLEKDHIAVEKARKGEHVGLLVDEPVHAKADVFLVE